MKNVLAKLINTKAENTIAAPKVVFSPLSEDNHFPLVAKPKFSGLILSHWIRENLDAVNEKLNAHGAILFRGFQIDAVEKFQGFIDACDAKPLEYRQRSSPRFEVAKNIYHSTTYPADQHINMHSENSYAYKWPTRIAFCCIQPAEEQGETPIADNRLVAKYLSEPTRAKFLSRSVKYVRNINKWIGLPWEEVFQTKDKAQVEEECRKNGMDFTWGEDEKLTLSWRNQAIYNHPVTGEEIWFNHSFFFNKYALGDEVLSAVEESKDLPFNTYFGDGGEISRTEIEEIRSAYEKATVVFPWEKGDVLYMDNMLTAHARSPYKGERQIIVSMF